MLMLAGKKLRKLTIFILAITAKREIRTVRLPSERMHQEKILKSDENVRI